MDFRVAAGVGGGFAVLSFLMGLLGSVAPLDIALRVGFWALVGFGATLGAEALLRSLVPDLFDASAATPVEAPEERDESDRGRNVDISVDDEASVRAGIEVVDDEEPVAEAPPRRVEPPKAEPVVNEIPLSAASAAREELPEMGSFLDAFRPGGGGEDEAAPEATSSVSDFVPEDAGPRSAPPPGSVTGDGKAEDPAVLAKAIQTVMKRDGQGS